jgi:hypothetical protein
MTRAAPSRSVGAYRIASGDASAEVLRHVSQHLDRGDRQPPMLSAVE